MRFEESCIVPVPAKVAWDYLIDPKVWPLYWNGMVEAKTARWEQPGDQMRFTYRLFGRLVEGSGDLMDAAPGEYLRASIDAPAVGTMIQEVFYEEIDEDATRVRIAYDTDEPTSLFGKLVDRTVLPTALRKDLKASIDHIRELFAFGPPEV